MATENNNSPTAKDFVTEHLTWTLSLVPFVLVGLKLLSNSRGNIEVFRYLLQNVSVVNLLLGSVVPLIPTALFWAVVIAVEWVWTEKRGDVIAKAPDWLFVPVFAGLFTIAALMPISALLVNGGLLVFLIAWRKLWRCLRRNDQADPLRGKPMRPDFLQGLAFATVGALFSTPGMWLPTEIVQVHTSRYTGYVLSSDGNWTTVLERDNTVNIFPTAKVDSRKPCAPDDWWSKPVWDIYPRDPKIVLCPAH